MHKLEQTSRSCTPRYSTFAPVRWPVTRLAAGVRLNIGTDTPDPGKSVLSEMLLFHDAGIPMVDVFRIATLETAMGIGHGSDLGTLEPGRRADMVLFSGDPLTRPRDLLGPKLVIKDGVELGTAK